MRSIKSWRKQWMNLDCFSWCKSFTKSKKSLCTLVRKCMFLFFFFFFFCKTKMPLFQCDLKIKHKFWHYIPVPILFQNACIKSVSFLIVIFHRTVMLEKTLESPLDCNGEGQGSLACCSPWGCKESDMT